jgi:D-ribose pyranose/furanose isomerase RbsD
MAYSKSKVEAVEEALLSACKKDTEIEAKDDSHLTRKKRDKETAHISNHVKQFNADEAMALSLQNKIERGDDVEGQIEEITGEGAEIQTEIIEKRQKNKELADKLSKYKGAQSELKDSAFDGLNLNTMQKKFIINLCNPDSPYYSKKHEAYVASGYTAKTKNSLMANISMNLKKPKIKTAIERYRKNMIVGKKIEISEETVEILRRRATYSLDTFYKDNGEMIPYSEIPNEWKCCVDDRVTDYKGAQANQKIEKYKLCDRHKSIETLHKLLEVQQSISEAPKNVGGRPSSVQAAIDMGKDKDGNQGPRVVFNISTFGDD